MRRRVQVTQDSPLRGPFPSLGPPFPPSKRHSSERALTPQRLLESTRPAPNLSYSLEVSGGEEKQRRGEDHCGAWAGGSWTLLGAIPACLQLREPVREPPVSTIACGWTWMGREKLQRLICLALLKHPHSQDHSGVFPLPHPTLGLHIMPPPSLVLPTVHCS